MMRKLLFFAALFCVPFGAYANFGFVDALNIAPFVPIVLDAMMLVATGTYDFFVGGGSGPIYILVWAALGVSLFLYVFKMYFPKDWLALFGMSGGGQFWDDKSPKGMEITQNALKPIIRAIVAVTLLLQIRPIYVTDWLVDPFLRFGAIYTNAIVSQIDMIGPPPPAAQCPPDVIRAGWISDAGCNFLLQPIHDLSHANNQIIKIGFESVWRGISGLAFWWVPTGGGNLLNIISGLILIFTFVASNFFMALLIIQGIFNFGMALIMFPFRVLVWVLKESDKWLDPWPAFEGIIEALRKLVVLMIAAAFILAINIAVIRALFSWQGNLFTYGIPSGGFGYHAILWMSVILTFYLMFEIFKITREKLEEFGAKDLSGLHKDVTGDAKSIFSKSSDWTKKMIAAARGKKKEEKK